MDKIKKIFLIALFSFILISSYNVANAASAGISANKTSVSAGSTVKIATSINAAAWNLHVSRTN